MKKVNKKGFTIIELIIVFAIAGIVLVPFSLYLTSSLRNTTLIQKNIDAIQDTQEVFILTNELLRSNGLSNTEIIPNYFGYGEALKIDDKIIVQKGTELVLQDYSTSSEQATNEIIMHDYIDHVVYTLSAQALNMEIHVDKDLDGNVDDVFPFSYSNRL
ncbi:MAG: type II secretion system protein [Clostridia bacterium]|nr:type II secretion system protein [Clostridia bacterium]